MRKGTAEGQQLPGAWARAAAAPFLAFGVALAAGAGCTADVTGTFPESGALLVGTLVVEAPEVGWGDVGDGGTSSLHSGAGVALSDPAQAQVSFTGRLDPGRDPGGRLRGVEVERLGLPSRELEPVGREGAGIRLYEGAWEIPWGRGEVGVAEESSGSGSLPGPSGAMEVTPPAVAGINPVAASFRFGSCGAVRLPEEEAVVVVECDRALASPVHVAWQLLVRRASTNAVVLRLEGDTEPPRRIQVPEVWLPGGQAEVAGEETSASSPNPWILELEITDRYGWAHAGGTYRTNLVVRWRHRWPGSG